MDYSQHSFVNRLSNLCSLLEKHVDEMRQENINAGWNENVDSSPYNFFSCVYCGESHLYEHCPYSTIGHYERDDFTRKQTCFDNSFYPSGSLEQQESLDPHIKYCSNEMTPSFHSYPYVKGHTHEEF